MIENNAQEILDAMFPNEVTYLNPVFSPLKRGMFVYRARRCTTSCTRYMRPECLSYVCDRTKVFLNRANLTGQPMFYGSVSSKDFRNGWVAAVEETVAETGEPQTLIVSRWEVLDEIPLVTVASNELQTSKMDSAKDMAKGLWDGIEQLRPEHRVHARELHTIVGDAYAMRRQTREDYLISACFAHAVLRAGKAGLSYPSVAVEYNGYNVAIRPEVVDQSLRLVSARVCQHKIIQAPNQATRFGIPVYEEMDIDDGVPFEWKASDPVLSTNPFTQEIIPWSVHD